MLGVLAFAFMAPHLLLGIFFHTSFKDLFGQEVGGLLLWLHVFLAMGIYFVWYWRHGGQTLAMQTWKICIVSALGGPLQLWQAWLRYALAWAGIIFGGAGLLWALFDRDRQFLHDRLAGTRIVFKAPK